jgi:hypothetical protein
MRPDAIIPAFRWAACAALLAAAPAAAQDAPAIDWPELFWNPVPLEGDVVLPMPCGAGMAFRRIDTPVAPNWLADERMQLGNNDVLGQEHSESVMGESIVGGLTDADADQRYYLMGKYEVTADQFAAVMEGCPEPSEDGAMPAEGMSRLDADVFAARLTSWLYEEAPGAMAGWTGAFLRLPTEEEWEFAARGGLKVTEAARRGTQFPMDGPLEDYVWFAGFKSCDGLTQPIGILEPNPLGLFDILGNVQEYVHGLYRMRTRERRHGQVGGATARGGSCLTAEGRVRTAARDEIPPFDPETGRMGGKPFTGMRLAVGSVVLSDRERITRINDDWRDLGAMRVRVDPQDDPIEALGRIAEAEQSPAVREALLRARDVFLEEMERRNEVEGLSARSVAQAGMLAIRSYILALDTRTRMEVLIEEDPEDEGYRAFAARAEERRRISEDTLMGMLVHGADNFDADTFAAAAEIVRRENEARLADMSERTRATTLRMLGIFEGFVETYRARNDTDPAVFRADLQAYYDELTGR